MRSSDTSYQATAMIGSVVMQGINCHAQPVRTLTLPDGSIWYRAKDFMGPGYFPRTKATDALRRILPAQTCFKRPAGSLLKAVEPAVVLPDDMHQSDVMLNAFGVMYLAIKLGNKRNADLSPTQCSILNHVMPELQGYQLLQHPSDSNRHAFVDMAKVEADPEARWFDVGRFIREALQLNHWPSDELIIQHVVHDHMSTTGKAYMRQSLLMPVDAAPYAQDCVVAALMSRQACSVSPKQRQQYSAELNRVSRADAVKLATNIASTWT